MYHFGQFNPLYEISSNMKEVWPMTPRRMVLSAAVLSVFTLAAAGTCAAAEENSFRYITPDELKEKIQSGTPITVLDIQVEDEYEQHHIKGALATHAYPVKSEEDRGKLDAVYYDITANADPIVIVCPRGGGGAKRAYEHLVSRGVDGERLLILEKGQGGWPYPELLE
jgi:thiosulfate/3-mercaptopyruvate sulfurtransferase